MWRGTFQYFACGAVLMIILMLRYLSIPVIDYVGEIQPLLDSEALIQGTVDSVNKKGNQTRLILQNVVVGKQTISSALYVIVPYNNKIVRWSHTKLKGKIVLLTEPNNTTFTAMPMVAMMYFPDVLEVIAPLGISGLVNSIQASINNRVNILLPEPHASLLAGIVFGLRREYDESFYEGLRQVGLLHIVVASGFNALVVAVIAERLTFTFPKLLKIVTFSTLMFTYVCITGFQIPIIRATIMTVGGVLAAARGEYKEGLWWLFISAYIMMLLNPMVMFSLSFQLSFAASLGIIILSDLLKKIFFFVPSTVGNDLVTTFAAQVFVLPLLLLRIGDVSLRGLIVNPLVLWTVTPVMYLGGVAFFISIFSTPMAHVLITPTRLLLDVIIFVTNTFG